MKWKEVFNVSQNMLQLKDCYGHGRSFLDFLMHFFLVAVPEKNVNNAFDYPMGLPYLLCFVPFCVYSVRKLFQKKISIVALMVTLFWMTWWIGSQQSRFLYIPVALMIIMVCMNVKSSKIFLGLLVFSVLLNTISLVRSHKRDWFKSSLEVVRKEDRRILKMNKEYFSGKIDSPVFHNTRVSFARFPVKCKLKRR